VPKYKVIAHRRVHKFISNIKDETLRNKIIDHMAKLEDYPITLREMDTEKIVKNVMESFDEKQFNLQLIKEEKLVEEPTKLQS